MRKSLCYKSFERGRCLNAMEINVTRQECCCMTGSAGWASPDGKCELCPVPSDSRLFLFSTYFFPVIFQDNKNMY